MESGGGGAHAESERILTIAASLLDAGDFVSCRRLAENAISMDPFADSALADQIIAASDVLLAAKVHANPPPHAILNIPITSTVAAASSAFRRLSLLLRNPSPLPAANAAFRLVSDAFAALCDPGSQPLTDEECKAAAADGDPLLTFWTACPSCFNIFQYPREFVDRMLRCHTCKRPFKAAEMQMAPPIVPGTDMYYCAWGFHPIGIPSAADLSDWKPFTPTAPPVGPLPLSSGNMKTKNDTAAAKRKKAAGAPKRKVMMEQTKDMVELLMKQQRTFINEMVATEFNLNQKTESSKRNFDDHCVMEPPDMLMSEPLNVQPLRAVGVPSQNIGVGVVAGEYQEQNPGTGINEGPGFNPNQEY